MSVKFKLWGIYFVYFAHFLQLRNNILVQSNFYVSGISNSKRVSEIRRESIQFWKELFREIGVLKYTKRVNLFSNTVRC